MKKEQIKSFLEGGLINSSIFINEIGEWPYKGHYLFDKPVPGVLMYTIFDATYFNTFVISEDPARDDTIIFSNADVTEILDISNYKTRTARGIGNTKIINSIKEFIEFMNKIINEEEEK